MALVEGQCVQQAGFSTCSTTSVTYHPASCVRTCWNVIPALLLCLSGTDGSDPTVKPSHPYHQPIAQKCSEWDASPPIKHKQKGDLRCELSGTIDKQWTPQANYANYGFKWLQLISIYHNLSLQYVSLLHLPVRTLGDFMTALVRSCYVGLKQLWSFSHDRKSLFWLVSFPRMVLWPSRTIGIQLWSIMYNPIFDALHMANPRSQAAPCTGGGYRWVKRKCPTNNDEKKQTNYQIFDHGTCSKWACVELRGIHCQ
jgi:hypothetical protein